MAQISFTDFLNQRSVQADDPVLEIAVDPTNPPRPQQLRVRLQVTDDSGNVSAPTEILVVIRDETRPTAVIRLLDEEGNALGDTVPTGRSFVLSGRRSSDASPGTVVSWAWTLLDG